MISLMILSGCNNSKSSNENGNLEKMDLKAVATDFAENYVVEDEQEEEETIKDIILYFSDYQAEYTVAETRNVEIKGSVEETIFEELKKDLKMKDYTV